MLKNKNYDLSYKDKDLQKYLTDYNYGDDIIWKKHKKYDYKLLND